MEHKEIDEFYRDVVNHSVKYIQDKYRIFNDPRTKPIIECRDSFLYRFSSVAWHLDILRAQHVSNENIYRELFITGKDSHVHLRNSHQIIYFLFDDIIFNVISMFDYFGNYLAVIISGENKRTIKWEGLLNSLRDKNNQMSECDVSQLIIDINKNFVEKLSKFRGDLFHRKHHLGDGEASIDLNDEIEGKIKILIPNKLLKLLPIFSKGEEVEIVDGATRVVSESIKIIRKILDSVDLSNQRFLDGE